MNPKITVYYGPRIDFEKYISSYGIYKKFIDIIYIHDSNKDILTTINKDTGKIEKEITIAIDNIVAFSDEYSLISESGTNAFISILNSFQFKNLILHNPPKNIVSQLEKKYKDIDKIYYEYTSFDLEKLKEINELYDKTIIGQNNVKKQLMRAILSNVKFSKQNRPVVIMFYGPSGVGKTETAKLLSSIIGQDLFRQQLSMFQSNEFSSFLFGDVHYKNSLARELIERKSNIILFDEFDKCPPNVYSAFYQLFDEGIFEDKNYTVELKNTIIICTSNFLSIEEIKTKLGDPIFYRFDSIIEFKKLEEEQAKKIINRQYNTYTSNLTDDDIKLLEEKQIRNKLLSVTTYFNNFRVLDNYIKELISEVILENYL